MKGDVSNKGLATKAIHAGQPPDQHTGAVMVPITLATTYAQESPGKYYPGGYEYSRSANPTRTAYEKAVSTLEGGKHGMAFSSGLAATATIIHLLKSGDHVITIDDVYGGTGRYFRSVVGPMSNIEFSFVDLLQPGALKANVKPGKTKMLWIETPTNPTMKIVDIAKLAKEGHHHNLIVVVDNTFMSPYSQRPLTLGADISLNSVSKYINGHSDVIGGFVSVKDDALADKLRYYQNAVGAVPSPFDCYMAMRGLKTLPIRMEQHQRNAMTVAKFLEGHPKVRKVAYPGLPSHPQHHIAKKQNNCFGGMITFWLKGDLSHARKFLENCKIFTLAESLGGVESLVEHPAIMTHASVPPELRAKLGIDDSLIRLSVGIETIDDLMEELKGNLDSLSIPSSKL